MTTLDHPYGDLSGGEWLRGSLHTHTTNSDGTFSPQEVLDAYAARGYGFLMLSDHDTYTSNDDYAQYDAKGLVLIPGNEISRGGPHLLHVDADRLAEPDGDRQKVIDEINATHGFAIVNHPNWTQRFNHCPLEKMEEWGDYVGMEIYNGVICRLDGSPYATNKWDILLSAGRRILGFANDDLHRGDIDIELGWNTAYVTDRSLDGVVESLATGRFYCSTGVTISAIEVDGMRIRIETENAQRVVALTQIGKRLAFADAASLEVEVPETAKYVRFECWGPGEQFAWTQPFYVVA